MRSTQADNDFPYEEQPEQHHVRSKPNPLCEAIKGLGYAENNQVRLYGEVFDLLSDPVSVGEHFVFVDALEQKSGQVKRVRIPPAIVQMARIKHRSE